MPMSDYERAAALIAESKDDADFEGQGRLNSSKPRKTHSGVQFPPTYRRFVSEYGAGNIGSTEIYGVIDFDFEASSIPDAVWHNLTMRREGLGHGLLSFYAVGDGQEFCLDTRVASDGEMPVVGVHFGGDGRYLFSMGHDANADHA